MNSKESLKEELQIKVDKFDDFGYTMVDEVLFLHENGKVSDAELFEKIIRGVEIDTTD